MLLQAENELVTRTGPGTAAGELMRRYWQPAALSRELPSGGAPLPTRILGEDLVLFRDEKGRPGLLGIHCSHRGADLSYGRLEDSGLRCIYHGWLYDIHGRCLEQPGEPAGSTFHEKIRHPAYPCQEFGGLVFAYMGPGDPPPLPQWEALSAPEEWRFATKGLRECNWLQGMEGTLDPQHQGFLHRVLSGKDEVRDALASNAQLTIEVEETSGGVCVMSMVKITDGRYFVKENRYLVPNVTVSASDDGGGYSMHWSVPVDDTHFWMWSAMLKRDPAFIRKRPERDLVYKTPDFQMTLNRTNRYLQNREAMKTSTFCGIAPDFQSQDACVIEGAGPIQDRSQEHLGYVDRGIAAMRRVLLRSVEELQEDPDGPTVGRWAQSERVPHTRIVAGLIQSSTNWQGALKRMEREASGKDELAETELATARTTATSSP